MKTSFVLPLLLLVASGHGGLVVAQTPGTFTATGNMTTRRYLHTATLLADGRVLIAGGERIELNPFLFKTLSSAELYDPLTGTFSVTGDMTMPRDGHTATLLPDGKVLIAGGGIFANPSVASAELYDPNTGTFGATGNMSVERRSPTATLLSNGKVLIAGGLGNAGLLASAEVYDPATGTFTATGNMNGWADTATSLPNAKVLITRGNTQGPGYYLSSAELYDASTGTFTSAGYLTVNHSAPSAVLLINGKVLVAGGDVGEGDGASVRAELYDPASGIFSSSGNMSAGREQNTATLLPDGTVLFAGGNNVIDLAASAEIYGPVQNAFSRTASMPTARELHTATLLNDGRVLIAGGDDERYWIPETILSSAEVYTPYVLVPAPVLLSLSGDGRGQGAIQHANTVRIASASDPAVAGEYLSIYLTGLADGGAIPPQIAIGGRVAEILYFGAAPGYPGYNQINVRVPPGVSPGPAVPVRLTYLGRASNEVTIGVQ